MASRIKTTVLAMTAYNSLNQLKPMTILIMDATTNVRKPMRIGILRWETITDSGLLYFIRDPTQAPIEQKPITHPPIIALSRA